MRAPVVLVLLGALVAVSLAAVSDGEGSPRYPPGHVFDEDSVSSPSRGTVDKGHDDADEPDSGSWFLRYKGDKGVRAEGEKGKAAENEATFSTRLSRLSKALDSGREYPFYAPKHLVETDEVQLGKESEFYKLKLGDSIWKRGDPTGPEDPTGPDDPTNESGAPRTSIIDDWDAWVDSFDKGLDVMIQAENPDSDLAIFRTSSGRKDCLLKGFIPKSSVMNRPEHQDDVRGTEYVDAEERYTKNVNTWVKAALNRKGRWLQDSCPGKEDACTFAGFAGFFKKFMKHMMGDGTAEKPGLIRNQLEEWFLAAGQYAQQHPGVIRALRKTLGRMLGMIQAWMVKDGNKDYTLTAREIDHILNVVAPSAMAVTNRKDQCGHLGGDVGTDPESILEVVSNGNIREMIMLIVATLDSDAKVNFKSMMLHIAEVMYGTVATDLGKVPQANECVMEKNDEQKITMAANFRALLEKRDDHMQAIDVAAMQEDYEPVVYQACGVLVVNDDKRNEFMRWLHHAGIEINLNLLWDQYRRYLFGDTVVLANPEYTDDDTTKSPVRLYHINGWAQVNDAIRSSTAFFYKKKLWTPRPGWVMASRLPGSFTIRGKPDQKILRARMRYDGIEEVHPAVWTWETMFKKLQVAYVSRREISWMQHCRDYRKLDDKRWAMFSPEIRMNDKCPWNSGRIYNVMLDKHFPLFSPTKRATYEQISNRQFGSVDAGPSGTTDEILLTTALMNGNTNDMWATRLGMIGYLVPYHHHTWLEVLQGGTGYGMEYDEENPSKSLMATEVKAGDCRLGHLNAIDSADVGMGPVGRAFDRQLTSLLALKNVDPAVVNGDVWRHWNAGVNTQRYDVSYTMSEEGTMLKFCNFAWAQEGRIPALVNGNIKMCSNVFKFVEDLHRKVCTLRDVLVKDNQLVTKANLSSRAELERYIDSRKEVCQSVDKAQKVIQFRVPGMWGACPRGGGRAQCAVEGDYGIAEILSLCSQVNHRGFFSQRMHKSELNTPWSDKAHTVFLRDLNGLIQKIAPQLSKPATGEVDCSISDVGQLFSSLSSRGDEH